MINIVNLMIVVVIRKNRKAMKRISAVIDLKIGEEEGGEGERSRHIKEKINSDQARKMLNSFDQYCKKVKRD